MNTSILNSVKQVLGLESEYDAFDQDIIMHINSTFSVLRQLGIGPEEGFMIEDSAASWDQFISTTDLMYYQMVKSYIAIKVRLLFDRPETSFAAEALEKMAAEYEWRLMAVKDEMGYSV